MSTNTLKNTSALRYYFKEIDTSSTSLLTKDEEIELSKKVQNGDKEARKEFIESNLMLVVSIAKLPKVLVRAMSYYYKTLYKKGILV